MKQVDEYFKDYPASKQCFTTSDSFVFHEKGDAGMHAQTLKDKTVEHHVKPVIADEEKVEAKPQKPKK
jgi:hypothetical protein